MFASLLLTAGLGLAAPDSLGPRLETGCAGGVTGGGSGAMVTASGHFYRWTRAGARAPGPTLVLIRTDSAEAGRLIRMAMDAGMQRIKFSQPSNMTCFLSWWPPKGRPIEVSWPWGERPKAIVALQAVADSVSRAAGGR